jgi:glycosyltransferase involved in cell wall biosynthesis
MFIHNYLQEMSMQNKITFIYDYKDGEKWSTPMALLNEFKERGWETEIVSITATDDSALQLWIQQDIPTDIVLFMDWGRIDSKWLDKSLKPNTFWIQESGDDPQNFERNYPKANRFHYTITPDKQSAQEYRNRGINAEWVNHFADTMVQFPMNIEPKYVAVTTRGYGNSAFLDYLTGWAEGAVGNRNGLDAKEHTEFLNTGLMVIQNSRWKEITRRIFEGMACGKLVITDRLSTETGLSEMFIDGEDIIYYDEMFDCIEKMNYYNENEEERERIAYNGMIKVLHNYTQIQLVDKLINNYNKFKKYEK